VDDERLARRELAYLLQAHPEIRGGRGGRIVKEAVKAWSPAPDLLFLDIRCRANSFDLFERTSVTAGVIFVTAHDDSPVRAFEVNALDYLMSR